MPYTRNYYENAHVAPGTENSGRPLVYLPHSPYAATAYEADPYGNVSALTGYPSQYPHVIRREHIPYRRNLRVVEPGFTELIREAAARDMFAYLDREQQRPRASGGTSGGTIKSKGTGNKPVTVDVPEVRLNLPEPKFEYKREAPFVVEGTPAKDDNDELSLIPFLFHDWNFGDKNGKGGGGPRVRVREVKPAIEGKGRLELPDPAVGPNPEPEAKVAKPGEVIVTPPPKDVVGERDPYKAPEQPDAAPGATPVQEDAAVNPEDVELIDISGQRNTWADLRRAISDPRVQAMALAVPGTGLAINGGRLLWNAMQLALRYPALASVMAGM